MNATPAPTVWPTRADLGGKTGHGPVTPEPEERRADELFHAPWEPRALALTLAMGATGSWNIDMSRAARETLPGYAAMSYYEIWVEALLRLLQERGLVQADELACGQALHPARPLPRVLREADVARVLAAGSPTSRPVAHPTAHPNAHPAAPPPDVTAAAQPAFAVGQRVRTRATPVPHHTRLPGYTRGRVGTVQALHGAHVFADTHAHGQGEQPTWLYTVAFEGAELWGAQAAEPGLVVSIDAWEPYLEAA